MNQIIFEFETKYGVYKDALHVDESVSEAEIEDMKQQRLNNWVNFIENPPVEDTVSSN